MWLKTEYQEVGAGSQESHKAQRKNPRISESRERTGESGRARVIADCGLLLIQ